MGRFEEAAGWAERCIEISRRVGERRYEPIARAVLLRAEAEDRPSAVAERDLRELWGALDRDA
jgi:hypothetical protein